MGVGPSLLPLTLDVIDIVVLKEYGEWSEGVRRGRGGFGR